MSQGEPHRPTLLLVGHGEPMAAAVKRALELHGLSVHATGSAHTVETVIATAPDLVLLIGDAAVGGGEAVIRHLAEHPTSSVVPVALLANDPSLDQRLKAFRSGAVAVVSRGASADAIARRVAALLRELPDRPGETSGELGEATLDELVALVSSELRRGILAVEPKDGETGTSLRLVLGAGRPVTEVLDGFVQRLRPLIERAEPLRYEFHEEPGGRLGLLDDDETGESGGDLAVVEGLRVLLMDSDPARADALAQALRSRGALVALTDVSERARERARGLDPEAIILDAAAIEGTGFEVVRALRKDSRLRWAALLVARWDELWPDSSTPPDVGRVAARLAPLLAHDRHLAERAQSERSFDTRLELTGPSRLLRTLLRVEGTWHLSIHNPQGTVDVDLADGLVVGARSTRGGTGAAEGASALAALLSCPSARVHVERREHPAVANIMAPVDEALDAAALEVPRSMPPVAGDPPVMTPSAPEGRVEGARGAPGSPPLVTTPVVPAAPPEGDSGGDVTIRPPEPVLDSMRKVSAGMAEGEQGSRGTRPVAYYSQRSTTDPAPDKRPARLVPRAKTLVGVGDHAGPGGARDQANEPEGGGPARSRRARPRSTAPGTVPAAAASEGRMGELAGPARVPGSEEVTIPDRLTPEHEATRPEVMTPEMAATQLDVQLPGERADADHPDDGAERLDSGLLESGSVPPPAGAGHEAGAGSAAHPPPRPQTPPPEPVPSVGQPSQSEAAGRPRRLLLVGALAVLGLVGVGGLTVVAGMGGADPGSPTGEAGEPPAPRAAATQPPRPPEQAGNPPAREADASTAVAEEPAKEDVHAGDDEVAVEDADEDAGADEVAGADEDAGADEVAGADEIAGADEVADAVAGEEEGSGEPDSKDEPEVVRRNPIESDRKAMEARRHILRGELDEAEGILELALRLDPRNPQAYAGFGQLYVARGDGETALEWIDQAVGARPRRAEYHVIRGDARELLGDDEGARRAWHTALKHDRRNRQARRRLRGAGP